jgi:hypothetical protein
MDIRLGLTPRIGGDRGTTRKAGDAMLSVGEYGHLVVRIAESSRRECGGTPSWRESLGTLVLGTLSTSLGITSLAALAVRNPSFDLVLTALVGQWLGIGGIFLALRIGRGMSPLCVLGTGLCLVLLAPLYLLVSLFLLGIVLWYALSVWAVRAQRRALGG